MTRLAAGVEAIACLSAEAYHVMGTGIRSAFGDDSTVHRHCQRWCYQRGWSQECTDPKGVGWQWEAADTAMGKARMAATKLSR